MESAYVRMINNQFKPKPAVSTPAASLDQRLSYWYNSLPEIARQRPFAMAEFERVLGTQGKLISPVLLSLGWTRKRKWTGAGQYNRYWLPPRACADRA